MKSKDKENKEFTNKGCFQFLQRYRHPNVVKPDIDFLNVVQLEVLGRAHNLKNVKNKHGVIY
jgi:hypothetical protein